MSEARVNGRIRARKVRVIDKDGQDLGMFTLGNALTLARTRHADLVEIDREAEPLLCQLIHYGEYCWRLRQAQKDTPHD